MARGRKTSLKITLTPAERRTLLAWQRSTTIRAGLCRRAQIILLVAEEGRSITAIAATVGISRRFVYKWAHDFWRTASRDWRTNLAVAPGACRARLPRRSSTPWSSTRIM
jgi:hypothetical protein